EVAKKRNANFSSSGCQFSFDDPDQIWANAYAQCSTPGAPESPSLDFLFPESGGLNSPDPVNIGFPFLSSQVTKSGPSSQSSQLELSESRIAPSKLQAKFQYYLQAVARRCSSLLKVSDFMRNSITLQEDLLDDTEPTQA